MVGYSDLKVGRAFSHPRLKGYITVGILDGSGKLVGEVSLDGNKNAIGAYPYDGLFSSWAGPALDLSKYGAKIGAIEVDIKGSEDKIIGFFRKRLEDRDAAKCKGAFNTSHVFADVFNIAASIFENTLHGAAKGNVGK